MNKASRFQRTLTFNRENESALLNNLGQGPAAYETHLIERIRFGEANKFTIPRVSITIISIHPSIIELGKKKDYFETRQHKGGQKDPHRLHRFKHLEQVQDQEGQYRHYRAIQIEIRCDKDEPY